MDDFSSKKKINDIKLQDLAKDLFGALTDINNRFFKTFWDLTVRPDEVIKNYVSGGQKKYFSVFRYFLVSIFVGYVSYDFFFEPDLIGGSFHTFIKDMALSKISEKNSPYKITHLDHEKFNTHFLMMSNLMSYYFKLVTCFSIPAYFIGFAILGRKSPFNWVSFFIASLFVGSHISFVSTLFMCLLAIFFGSSVMISWNPLIYLGIFIYTFYFNFRLFKAYLNWPIISGFSAALLSAVLLVSLYVGYGISLSLYVNENSKTYYYNEYPDPRFFPKDFNPEKTPNSQ